MISHVLSFIFVVSAETATLGDELANEAALLLQTEDLAGESCLLLQSDMPTDSKEACLLLQGAQHISLEVGSDAETDLSSAASLNLAMRGGAAALATDRFAEKMRKVVEAAAAGEKLEPSVKEALSTIDDTMNDVLNHTLEEDKVDRKSMQESVDAIAQCGSETKNRHTEAGGILELHQTVNEERTNHVDCRTTEGAKNRSMIESCTSFSTFRETLANDAPNKCACTWPYKTRESSNKEARHWLQPVPAPEVERCLDTTNTWSIQTSTTYTHKKDACHLSRREYGAQVTKCNRAQSEFEIRFCEYAQLLKTTCKDQTECRERTIKAHNETCAEIAIKVHARKAQTFAAEKVKCYIKILTTENYTDYTHCERKEVDVSHLDILCLPVPDAAPCDTSPVTHQPCANAWLGAEYSGSWVHDAKPNDCVPCFDNAISPAPNPPVVLR